MPRKERIREVLHRPLDEGYLEQRAERGWRLAAVEWERDVAGEEPEPAVRREEVPFGLRVSDDCLHLEENPEEMEALRLLTELIVQDTPFTRMAEELNRRGCASRGGEAWNPVRVFQVMPRLIEAAPRILASPEWAAQRGALAKVAWNS